jgi:hypothetical protein
MAYTPENRKAMLSIFDSIKANIDKITNATVRSSLQGLFASQDVANATDDQLVNWLKDSDVVAGITSIESNPELIKGLYAKAGVALPVGVSTTPTGDFDPIKLLAEKVGLPIPIATAIGGYLFGGGPLGALKWGAGGTAVSGLWNWICSEDGQKMITEISSGLGADGLKGLLTGGAAGIGEFLKNGTGALGDIFKGDQMQHIISMAKENPLATIAMVVAAGMAFNSGKGIFGSLFEFGKLALVALAATWVAETYLGVGGNRSAAIDHSMTVTEVSATALPVPTQPLQVAPAGN